MQFLLNDGSVLVTVLKSKANISNLDETDM